MAETDSTKGHDALQGREIDLATLQDVTAAVEEAFDYRGDVTVWTRDGAVVEGYIFDRRKEGSEPYLRLMAPDRPDRIRIRYADITRLAFTGRDTAAGKSWETWVRKYQEKKARGEAATIEPEKLE